MGEKFGDKVGEKTGEKVGQSLGGIHKLNLCPPFITVCGWWRLKCRGGRGGPNHIMNELKNHKYLCHAAPGFSRVCFIGFVHCTSVHGATSIDLL